MNKQVMSKGRKRPRSSIMLVLVGGISLITSGTSALSSVSTRRSGIAISTPSLKTPPLTTPGQTTQTESIKSDEGEVEAIAVDPDMLELIQRLQESTGPEVLSSDEQALAESKTPESFLEQLGGESATEKVAMSSITEQLPKAPLRAFSTSQGMAYSHHRVTADQEQQLGRLIQWGAAVMQHKCDNPKEWAAAAGLPSTKALRQTVVAYQRAKHLLVTANMGLVHAVVQGRRLSDASYEELLQEGSLGLMRAAELFDPSRGLRFSTYAVVWIKGVLGKSNVAELVRVPYRERVMWNKMVAAERALRAQNTDDRYEPSVADIAGLTGLTVEQVQNTRQHFLRSQYMASLDARSTLRTSSGSQAGSVEEQVKFDDEGLAERTQFQADLIALLKSKLDSREARFMRLRYGLNGGPDRTLQECAEAMGLSYSSMHKLNKKCLKKLREADEIAALEDYLFTIA